MTRTEKKLHVGAEQWWPGSGDDLVLVYRSYNQDGDRGGSMWAAATIAVLLREPAARSRCLAELTDKLPTSSKIGPKHDRSCAAAVALTRLSALRGPS